MTTPGQGQQAAESTAPEGNPRWETVTELVRSKLNDAFLEFAGDGVLSMQLARQPRGQVSIQEARRGTRDSSVTSLRLSFEFDGTPRLLDVGVALYRFSRSSSFVARFDLTYQDPDGHKDRKTYHDVDLMKLDDQRGIMLCGVTEGLPVVARKAKQQANAGEVLGYWFGSVDPATFTRNGTALREQLHSAVTDGRLCMRVEPAIDDATWPASADEVADKRLAEDAGRAFALCCLGIVTGWVLRRVAAHAPVPFRDASGARLPTAAVGVLKPRLDARRAWVAEGDLMDAAKAAGLFIDVRVLRQLSTAVSLGRHVLLTGPPGCGKSELAALVARVATARLRGGDVSAASSSDAYEPKVVTASGAWTSGDVIGRYFPVPRESDGSERLEFQPGVFLQALNEERWLVIDEFNRADMDRCFGELFSVLAGQAVDLPFVARSSEPVSSGQDPVSAGEDQEADVRALLPVRVVPVVATHVSVADRETYEVPSWWRMIGTMNDVDRSSLHQLSFALLRRFDVIRMDTPPANVLEELLKSRIDKLCGGWGQSGRMSPSADLITAALGRVFLKQHGLVVSGVVGIAPMLDVAESVVAACYNRNGPADLHAVLWDSVLSRVLPQFDALDEQQAERGLKHLLETVEADETLMRADMLRCFRNTVHEAVVRQLCSSPARRSE